MGLPPYYSTPVGISTSHTLAGTQSALALIGLVRADSWRAAANTFHSLHRSCLLMARSTSGPPTNSRAPRPARTGPCFRDSARTWEVSHFSSKFGFAHESERIARAVCRKTWVRGVRQSGRSRRPAAA